MNPKLYLSWADIKDNILNIRDQVIVPNHVIGISRGGLVPATMLSHLWGSPLLVATSKSYEHQNKVGKPQISFNFDTHALFGSVVIVDDILDSGETLEQVYNALRYLNPSLSISIVTICHKMSSLPKLGYWKTNIVYAGIGVEDHKWVVFPWELE